MITLPCTSPVTAYFSPCTGWGGGLQPGRGEKEGSSTVLLPRYSRSGAEEELENHFVSAFLYVYDNDNFSLIPFFDKLESITYQLVMYILPQFSFPNRPAAFHNNSEIFGKSKAKVKIRKLDF